MGTFQLGKLFQESFPHFDTPLHVFCLLAHLFYFLFLAATTQFVLDRFNLLLQEILTLLLVNKDNLLIHTLIQSDQYNVRNEYDKAIRLLTDYLALQKDYEHDVAICAYTLSESYRLKGDKEKEKEYLIVSAMADMKTAVREYISLRKLAVLLYQEGDIDRKSVV